MEKLMKNMVAVLTYIQELHDGGFTYKDIDAYIGWDYRSYILNKRYGKYIR